MQHITLAEAVQQLSAIVDAAAKGETFVIVNDAQEPLAQISPPALIQSRPRFGSAAGLIWMSDDFDAPLDDFAEYME